MNHDVTLIWREGGERRETRGETLGQTSGLAAAQLFVDMTFPDAICRVLVRKDDRAAAFTVDRGGEVFEVEASFR